MNAFKSGHKQVKRISPNVSFIGQRQVLLG